MAWIMALALLVIAMLALEGIWAERNFSRSTDGVESDGWDAALIDKLLLDRSR